MLHADNRLQPLLPFRRHCLLNLQRVINLVAYKLEWQWLWKVYFGEGNPRGSSPSYNYNTLTTLKAYIRGGVITNVLQSSSIKTFLHALNARQWFPHRCSKGCLCMCCGCKMSWAAASQTYRWVILGKIVCKYSLTIYSKVYGNVPGIAMVTSASELMITTLACTCNIFVVMFL